MKDKLTDSFIISSRVQKVCYQKNKHGKLVRVACSKVLTPAENDELKTHRALQSVKIKGQKSDFANRYFEKNYLNYRKHKQGPGSDVYSFKGFKDYVLKRDLGINSYGHSSKITNKEKKSYEDDYLREKKTYCETEEEKKETITIVVY